MDVLRQSRKSEFEESPNIEQPSWWANSFPEDQKQNYFIEFIIAMIILLSIVQALSVIGSLTQSGQFMS